MSNSKITASNNSTQMVCMDGCERSFDKIRVHPDVVGEFEWYIPHKHISEDSPMDLGSNPFTYLPKHMLYILQSQDSLELPLESPWVSVQIEDTPFNNLVTPSCDVIGDLVLYNPSRDVTMLYRNITSQEQALPHYIVYKGSDFLDTITTYEIGFHQISDECITHNLAMNGYKPELISTVI